MTFCLAEPIPVAFLPVMRTAILCTLILLVTAIAPMAQSPDTARVIRSAFIPDVRINDRAAGLQTELYPELYRGRSAAEDMAWVAGNEHDLAAFWSQSGDSVLTLLTRFSGLEWRETGFDLYLLRYFPTSGAAEPLLLPVGGVRQGALIEAIPTGAVATFNLIYHLAERMLLQALRPDASGYYYVANHPLMEPTPYRRDQMVMLLTLATGKAMLGPDSTEFAYQSPFWRRHFVGRPIFEQLFKSAWALTIENPLTRRLANEPAGSDLVTATDLPDNPIANDKKPRRQFIEGLPLKGELGFSTRLNNANRLVVDKIDDSRLAYACGLRQGDQIGSVDGDRITNQRELIEAIFKNFETMGAVLQVTRGNTKETIFLRPGKGSADTGARPSPDDSI